MRILTFVLLICWVTVAASAQDRATPHYCGTDLTSEASRAALAAYTEARLAGTLPVAAKRASPPQIGDRKSFNVLIGDDISTGTWGSRTFELFDIAASYYLWVEVNALGAMSTTQRDRVRSLDQTMSASTPTGSLRPDRGILANNLELFGELPDSDGDGMMDILMYDIEPGRTTGPSTNGYVSSVDLAPNPPAGAGNQRDVLYLDAVQGIGSLDRLAGIAAHELTHLIHFRYGGNESFIMEGLAEYAMIANGYFWRPADYLLTTLELTQPLFTWRQDINDYERGSLFFGYIAERAGPEIMRSITQTSVQGPNAVDNGLKEAGLALRQVIADFHTANLLNDRTLAPEFGYVYLHRAAVRAVRPSTIDGERVSSMTRSGVALEGGAVQYVVWRNVRNLELRLDTPSSIPAYQEYLRNQIRARLILTRSDGSREWHDVVPAADPVSFSGGFSEALLVIASVSGATSVRTTIDYSASWQGLSTANEPGAELPSTVTLGPAYPNPFNPATVLPFSLPASGHVSVRVYDVLGRLVRTLEDGVRSAGEHEVRLDADGLPGGTYLVVLDALGARNTRTVTLLP